MFSLNFEILNDSIISKVFGGSEEERIILELNGYQILQILQEESQDDHGNSNIPLGLRTEQCCEDIKKNLLPAFNAIAPIKVD